MQITKEYLEKELKQTRIQQQQALANMATISGAVQRLEADLEYLNRPEPVKPAKGKPEKPEGS